MKIYPGNHSIVSTEDILINHIPLALITNEEPAGATDLEITYGKNIRIAPTQNKIYPYQTFSSNEIYFFDKDNNPVDGSEYLKRDGNNYYFEPKKSLEFIPRKFNYSVLILKNDTYKNNVDYDIKIGTYSGDLSLAEKLIGISKSQETPANIKINSGSTLSSSFINIGDGTDFIFTDKNYLDYDKFNTLKDLINKHTNVWITCDKWENLIKEDTDKKPVFLHEEDGYIYPYNIINGIDYYIDTNYEIEEFPKSEYEYINLFIGKCPALILKKEEGAFVIISKESLLNNTDINNKLVYEVLLKIYLNSFYQTQQRQSVIADKNIDYYIRFSKFNKSHPDLNLSRILYQDNFNANIKYDLAKVITDEDISFLGLDKFNNLRFKSNIKVDPEKENNYSSVLTANDTIIYFEYDKNNLSLAEDNLNIYSQKNAEQCYIIVEPYRSSSKKISSEKICKILVPEQGIYVLFYDYTAKTFGIIESERYNYNSKTTLAMATIELKPKVSDWHFRDIRTLGGGEASDILNYDMIDTGSIKGRPYRLGSTLIIRLPERYRKYKDNLMTEIKKHISSADYPILIFE